jgi:hypothetical protein
MFASSLIYPSVCRHARLSRTVRGLCGVPGISHLWTYPDYDSRGTANRKTRQQMLGRINYSKGDIICIVKGLV